MPLWRQARYPGDAVRTLALKRGRETGAIHIQQYSANPQNVRVASFLPGHTNVIPGDTPKLEPEREQWCSSSYQADEVFDLYVQEAYAQGWQNYYG